MKRITEEGKITFTQAMKHFIKGYFDFRGHSTRASFWWTQLGIALIYILLFIITGVTSINRDYFESTINPFMVLLVVLFTLFIIVPSCSLTIRRLRDTGLKSKTILAVVILYCSFYSVYVMTAYSRILSLIPYAMDYNESYFPPMLGMVGSDSPWVILLFTLLSLFISITMFLPTDMYATKSDNKILLALFKKL